MANEILSAAQLTAYRSWVRYGVEGVNGASVSVTYTQVTARTISPTTGTSTQTTTATGITATRLSYSSSHDNADRKESGKVCFVFDAARLAAAGVTEPARKDRITENSIQYEVEEWTTTPTRSVYWVICSKVGT